MSIRRASHCLEVVTQLPRSVCDLMITSALENPKVVPATALPKETLLKAAALASTNALEAQSRTATAQFHAAASILRRMPCASLQSSTTKEH